MSPRLPSATFTALFLTTSLLVGACGSESGEGQGGNANDDAELAGSTADSCADDPCPPDRECVDCAETASFQCLVVEAAPEYFACGIIECLADLDACVSDGTAGACGTSYCQPRPTCEAADPCTCVPAGCTGCTIDEAGQMRFSCPG